MSDNAASSFNFKLYTPHGVEVLFHILPQDLNLSPTADDFGKDALAYVATLLAAGWSATLPGLEPGERREVVNVVMRRQKDDGTNIIDFFRDNLQYAVGMAYLDADKPERTAAFLAASGFASLDAVPLYDGQSPLKRVIGKPNVKETAVPRPFAVILKPTGKKTEKGNDQRRFDRYEAVAPTSADAPASPPQQPPAPPTPPTKNVPTWWKAAVHDQRLIDKLGDTRDSVLRNLLNAGKVTLDTPLEAVVAAALETQNGETELEF